MKGNGLSSTHREALKKLNRQSNYASHQTSFLAAKERQKSLRLQAEKAWTESQKRVLQSEVDAAQATSNQDQP